MHPRPCGAEQQCATGLAAAQRRQVRGGVAITLDCAAACAPKQSPPLVSSGQPSHLWLANWGAVGAVAAPPCRSHLAMSQRKRAVRLGAGSPPSGTDMADSRARKSRLTARDQTTDIRPSTNGALLSPGRPSNPCPAESVS